MFYRKSSFLSIKEFFLTPPEGGSIAQQHAQLQILYRARGNKIEELIADLNKVKEDDAREIRILKHRVNLAEG